MFLSTLASGDYYSTKIREKNLENEEMLPRYRKSNTEEMHQEFKGG